MFITGEKVGILTKKLKNALKFRINYIKFTLS
jgi:hypothetical protein